MQNTLADFSKCLQETTPTFVPYVSEDAIWSNGDFGQYFNPIESGDYIVNFLDDQECPQTDTVAVSVDDCLASCLVTAPTSFSPNESGANDIFSIIYTCPLDVFEFSIYNLWGELIYYTEDPLQGWDGTVNNEKSPIGIKEYILKNFILYLYGM